MLVLLLACHPGGVHDSEGPVDHGRLLGLGVTPTDPILQVGDTLGFHADAFYEDTTAEDVTGEVTWIVTDDRVAAIDAAGLATAVEPGETDVVATWQDGKSAKVKLTVKGEDAVLTGVVASPPSIEIHSGDTVQVAAVATYSDGSTGNLAGACTWASDDASVASVDAIGKVTGQGVGSTSITADCPSTRLDIPTTVVGDATDLPKPDLRISYLEGQVSGDVVTYTAIVENDGDGYASGFYVDVFLDRSSAPGFGDDWDAYGWVAGLAADGSTPVYIDVHDVGAGTYASWALADSDQTVDEGDEGNNASGPVTVAIDAGAAGPNLVIAAFEGASDGSYTTWYVEVANDGDEPSPGCWVDLFYDASTTPSIGDDGDDYAWVPELDPGDSVYWEPDVYDGPYDYWESAVFVDSADDVSESDEDDNLAWIDIVPY